MSRRIPFRPAVGHVGLPSGGGGVPPPAVQGCAHSLGRRRACPTGSSSRFVGDAFTLIELLVVVAILAILAALLMPGLKSARDTAKAANCASNLKQIGLGAHLFANENDGWLPYANESSAIRWWNKIGPYAGAAKYGTIPSSPGQKVPVSNSLVWTCPVTRNNSWLGYGWNYSGIGHSPSQPYFGPTRIGGRKIDCFLVADSVYAQNPANGSYSSFDMMSTPTGTVSEFQPRVHAGGLNVLFVDGRVQRLATADFLKNPDPRWGFWND